MQLFGGFFGFFDFRGVAAVPDGCFWLGREVEEAPAESDAPAEEPKENEESDGESATE